MGKTGKWLRNLLTGKKKDREKQKEKCATNNSNLMSVSNGGSENPSTPISTTPKEKKRWSFRRSSASATHSKELNFAEASVTSSVTVQTDAATDAQNEQQKKHAMAVAAATAAAADAAVAAASAAAAVIRLTSGSNGTDRRIEEAAAIKIQSVFRSYLARKAMCALRGLVKLQALVRGHLVRKHASETLRCIQALVIAQARARAQRARMVSEGKPDQKLVEMDNVCESKGYNSRGRNNRTSNQGHSEHSQHRFSTYYHSSKEENYKASPSPSALTEFSPRSFSGHLDDRFFGTAQSSPHYYSSVSKEDDSELPFGFQRPSSYSESLSSDYPLFPNYMANTESSRAKARSHSAPKQRPESYERQPSRRRASVEGRNVPRPVRMQRSSSHVGLTAQNYQYPWSIKLDKSMVSLRDSGCGSTTTVLTNSNNYCRTLVAYDGHGYRY